MDDAKRAEFDQNVLDMANNGLRTFTVAYTDLDSLEAWDNENPSVEKTPLTVIAILGIQDPVRAEVPAAVATCKRAGITVRMVTGDKKETAAHIATTCGIYDPTDPKNSMIMTGAEFRENFARFDYEGDEAKERKAANKPMYEFRYDKEKVFAWLPKLHVLARSSPEDKEMMVCALKDMGNVVGATGDGTNDAPALKAANVGLAMGITGTELAKEAADIILLDDRFQSIVEAVKWGRNIFLNIRKFLQFQLTVNVVALCVAFIAACFGKMPLTPIQLLWVNLIMDTFAGMDSCLPSIVCPQLTFWTPSQRWPWPPSLLTPSSF
jgi:magnesium-transporting ATPase (P-type)